MNYQSHTSLTHVLMNVGEKNVNEIIVFIMSNVNTEGIIICH